MNPMTREEAHRGAASVAGEMALCLVRPGADVAQVRRWVDTLRRVADALEARIKGVTG